MKKIFALLLVALFGAVPLFADDVADVKATFVRELELSKAGDFAGKLALYAPDYLETAPDGMTANYEQAKWLMLALDGKHPKEFLLVWATDQLKGAEIPAEMMARIDAAARNPEFIKEYEAGIPTVVAMIKAEADLELKTLKFVNVKVDGGEAVAVVEYDSSDPDSKEIKHKIATFSLRKVDGQWIFYRSVIKIK